MTHVWIFLIGPDRGSPFTSRMWFVEHVVNEVQANMPRLHFSVKVWTPFRSVREYSGQRHVIVLLVSNWREFTRKDYLVASCALALHQTGEVHLVTVPTDSVAGSPTTDPWLEQCRLIWERLASLATMGPPHGTLQGWCADLADCVRHSIYATSVSPHDAQEPTAGPLSVFFSYCHRDEELRGELGRHLKLLERVGLIKGWHDREIAAGDEWAAEINVHLYTADLLLLLLSSDFFASDYCEIEAAIALERHNANAARAIPVVLRPVVWRQSPLSVLQALPKDGRPVVEWPSSDLAFVNVCEGILNSVLSWRNETRSANVPRTQELRRFSSRRRMLDVAMPAEVEIGKSVMLVVLVRKALSAGLRALLSGDVSYGVEPRDVHSKAVLLRFPIGQTNKPESISLTVLLRTPDFDPPEQKRSLTLQPDEDSQPLIFILAPKRAGALKAVVEIYYKDELVTSCPLSTLAAVAQVLKLASPNIASATFDVGGAELDAKTQQALQLLQQHRMTDAMAVVNLALREFPDAVELHALREMVAVALENQRWQAQDEKRQRDEEESFARGKTEALERPMAVPSAPAPSGRRSRLPFVLLDLACLLLAVVLFLLLR